MRFFNKNKRKLKIIGIILGALVVVYFALLSPQLIDSFQAGQTARNYEKWEESVKEQYRNDTYGGDTPEETWAMFLSALEKRDFDLAVKYFDLNLRLTSILCSRSRNFTLTKPVKYKPKKIIIKKKSLIIKMPIRKEIVYPIFLECVESIEDTFWKNTFEDLAYGKSPHGTYISNDFLICKSKDKEFNYKIERKNILIMFRVKRNRKDNNMDFILFSYFIGTVRLNIKSNR